MIEPLLLAVVRVNTFAGAQALTNASGFFFERSGRLYLVSCAHVFSDRKSSHFPDRIEIELHLDARDATRSVAYSIPLYVDGNQQWREAFDGFGRIDVATIAIDRSRFPKKTVYRAFTRRNITDGFRDLEVGDALLVPCFPLGFHDTVHHLPVVRQAIIASSFGIRFQGRGYFISDGRTHRGSSGAPVVARASEVPEAGHDLPWTLAGIHSARFDVGTRDAFTDEALGLNSVWYADVLLELTDE